LHEIRPGAQGLFEAGHRLERFALAQLRDTKVIESFRKTWAQIQGFFELSGSLIRLALAKEGIAKAVYNICRIRPQQECLTAVHDGRLEFAERFQGNGEVSVGIGKIGPQAQGFLELRYGIFVAAKLTQQNTEKLQTFGIRGIGLDDL